MAKDAAPGRSVQTPWTAPPEPGGAVEVAEGVLWMRLPLPMVLNHVNVYALDDGDGWTLVDTGIDTPKSRDIWERLLDGPLGGIPVRRLICTHHHLDHLGLAGWFQSKFGAELMMTRTAWLMGRMLSLDVQDRPTPETLAFWRSAGMDPEVLEKRTHERPFNSADAVHPLPVGFTRLNAGDIVRIGGRNWDLRIGHGHAPAHATFWSRDDNLVISGDQILSTISPNIGVYPTEPEADPLGEWLQSCSGFLPHARDDHLVLGGHKLPFVGLPARLSALMEEHHSALERLLSDLAQPRSAGACFDAIFQRPIRDGEYGLALVEAVAHVNHLYKQKLVTRTRGAQDAWFYQAIGG